MENKSNTRREWMSKDRYILFLMSNLTAIIKYRSRNVNAIIHFSKQRDKIAKAPVVTIDMVLT